MKEFAERARAAGVLVGDTDDDTTAFSHLVQACKANKILTVRDLDRELQKLSKASLTTFFKRFLNILGGGASGHVAHFIAVRLAAGSGASAEDLTATYEWMDRYSEAIVEVSKSVRRRK